MLSNRAKTYGFVFDSKFVFLGSNTMFLLKEGNARIDHCEGGCQNRVTGRQAESIIKCVGYLGYGTGKLWVTHCCSNDKSSNKGKFHILNENLNLYFKEKMLKLVTVQVVTVVENYM